MKRMVRRLATLGLFVVVGCSGNGQYADGVYEGTGEGYYGQLAVEVTVDGGMLTGVRITDSEETPAMLEPVNDVLIPQIVDGQGVEGVDTISGATGTSQGVLNAVEAALEGARVDS